MKVLLIKIFLLGVALPALAVGSTSAFDGRWALVPARSSALDGWTNMHLVLEVDDDQVDITYDMRWRSTRVVETNSVNTGKTVKIPDYFRIEQRHMAVYPVKDSESRVSAEWLDKGRTLMIQAEVPVEISQGETTMRIYCEYRLGVDDGTLTVIELHSTRNNPLVYRFTKLPTGDTSRP